MTAAAILAGGRARRLGGTPKPLLVVDGRRVIDRQLAILAPLFADLVIVANDPAPFAGLGIEVIADRHGPALGPLAGLDAALGWLPAGCDSVLCVAGDMPYLASALVERLRNAPPAPAVVPRFACVPQPLCGRYHRSVASAVDAALRSGSRGFAMHAFLERLPGVVWLDEPELRRLDPDLRTFTNLNTPADLAACAGQPRPR